MMAFITTGMAPTVPASPAPLAPSGLYLVGTGLLLTSMFGIICGARHGVVEEARRSGAGRYSRSHTTCSHRIWPMPCATPPWIWPFSPIGFITVPTSSTTT